MYLNFFSKNIRYIFTETKIRYEWSEIILADNSDSTGLSQALPQTNLGGEYHSPGYLT